MYLFLTNAGDRSTPHISSGMTKLHSEVSPVKQIQLQVEPTKEESVSRKRGKDSPTRKHHSPLQRRQMDKRAVIHKYLSNRKQLLQKIRKRKVCIH